MDDEDVNDVKDCWEDSDEESAPLPVVVSNAPIQPHVEAVAADEADDDDIEEDDVASVSSASSASHAGAGQGVGAGELLSDSDTGDLFDENEGETITDDMFLSADRKKLELLVDHWLLKLAKCASLNGTFSENNCFIIDLDAFLLNILQRSEKTWDKNRVCVLQILYLVERYAKLFSEKGGNFEFVAFGGSEIIWQQCPTMRFLRWTLIRHIESNTAYRLRHFESCSSHDFEGYISRLNPVFVLTLMSLDAETREQIGFDSICEHLFLSSSCFLEKGMTVALVDTLEYTFSRLQAFWIEPGSTVKEVHWNTIKLLETLSDQSLISDESYHDAKPADMLPLSLISEALKLVRKKFPAIATDDVTQATIYASYLISNSPFTSRPFTTEACTDAINQFISQMSNALTCLLKNADASNLKSFQPDIFDFNVVSNVVNNCLHKNVSLPTNYCSALTQLNVLPMKEIQGNEEIVVPELNGHISVQNEIIRVQSPILNEYVADFTKLEEGSVQPKSSQQSLDQLFMKSLSWATAPSVSDEYSRIADNSENRKVVNFSMLPRRQQRLLVRRMNAQKQKFVRFMTRYGRSLEGGSGATSQKIVSTDKKEDVVVSTKAQSNKQIKKDKKSNQGQQKVSKASQKIIEKNMADKKSAKENEIRRQMSEFKNKCASLENRTNKLLPEVEELKVHYKEFRALDKDYPNYMTDILWCICNHIANTMGDNVTLEAKIQVVYHLKEIHHLRAQWSQRTEAVIIKLCCLCAFHDLLPLYGLSCKPHPNSDDSFARFQLKDMGHMLVRDVRTDPDPRVTRFIPDTWQRVLFDAIDNNQSALICAPTSSGKTYASFYCMEQVLKNDDEGVIVYVSPTKALVNQVAATVCARYDKNLSGGKCLYGVFTAEYRENAQNCQILITVPHCLELLLLSDKYTEWVSKVRYVIFDEVHCIGMMEEGSGSGIVWEHCITGITCPFLALSATVENPDMLHKWLQDAEAFKLARDQATGTVRASGPESYNVVKVEYNTRHNDLDHYLFHGQDMMKVHPCTLFDQRTAEDNSTFPKHLLLSPAESLELFQQMSAVEPKSSAKFEPKKYFAESTFLTKNQVTEYTEALLQELWRWKERFGKEEFEKKFNKVMDNLSDISGYKCRSQPHHDEVVDNFVPLLESLKKNDMLPAIVFLENRSLCEDLVAKAAEHIREKNQEAADAKDDKARDKIMQKAEKLAKKQSGKDKDKNKKEDTEGSKLDMLMQARDEASLGKRDVYTFAGKNCDEEDKKYAFERMRLNDISPDSPFRFGLEHGISYHHAGMNAKKRGGVEMMFRLKHLQVVVATGTLAMGIHVPCRTVVFTHDSNYLNTLTFRQMAGRAGRRGFDLKGNIVFTMIPYSKIQSLVASKLPKLMGNTPVSNTLVLRVLAMVSKADGPQRLTSALSLLKHPLIIQQVDMTSQLQLHFYYTTQFLYQQNLIDAQGKLQSFAPLVCQLQSYEPANFVFVYLLKKKYFHEMFASQKDKGTFSPDLMKKLLCVICHLFTNQRLPKNFEHKRLFANSKVILRDLNFAPGPSSKTFAEAIGSYNDQVKNVYRGFLSSASSKLPSEKSIVSLPVSGVKFGEEKQSEGKSSAPNFSSAFMAMSGLSDSEVFNSGELLTNLRPELYIDSASIPVYKISDDKNAFALDYYTHGNIRALRHENRIPAAEVFTTVKDFIRAVKQIQITLEEMSGESEGSQCAADVVVRAFKQLVGELTALFYKDYPDARV